MPDDDVAAAVRLMMEVRNVNIRGVQDTLAAGASADGTREFPLTPLMMAVHFGRLSMAKLLIDKGADLEICAEADDLVPDVHTGMLVVHLAVASGRLDALRMLLEAGANPNSTDEDGCTPLMVASQKTSSTRRAKIVQELLNGGADPYLSDREGNVALHFAAALGDIAMMDALLSQAPTTLNQPNFRAHTPLCAAASKGAEGAVSHLLSAGASNRTTFDILVEKEMYTCPLGAAVVHGHENVVNILLDDGLDAIGGLSVIPLAITCTFRNGRPRILNKLLDVEGEKRRGYWARCCLDSFPVLHVAVLCGDPTCISVLLTAGADERVCDHNGEQAWEKLGMDIEGRERDAVKDSAVLRTLERGPAFRARSWRWPSKSSTAAAAADDAAPLSSRPPRTPLDIHVFQPRDRTYFVNLVGRYAQKP